MSFDDEYYKTVTELQEEIKKSVDKLSKYKTDYLDNLYKETQDPVKALNGWLDVIWPLCQSGGFGYSFKISYIDYTLVPSELLTERLQAVHHISMWPSSWNIKTDLIHRFRQSITPDIHTAARALGLKIIVDSSEAFQSMTDYDPLFF